MEFIEELRKESENTPILVEGIKDVIALRKQGIKNAIPISGKPFYKVVESLKSKEVILLFDRDVEGKKLEKTFVSLLQDYGKKPILKYEKFLSKLKISHVEGIRGDENGESFSRKRKIYYSRSIRSKRNCRKARRNWSNIRANRRSVRDRS